MKLALAICLAALLTWLAVTPPPATRMATLQELVTAGQLRRPAPERTDGFRDLVTLAARVAGIDDPVVVNGPPVPGALHFYLTDPRTRDFTGCAEGNAVYDADLDAVFVDESLFRPDELGRMGPIPPIYWFSRQPRQFAFTRTFLTLVLLHELGHRALHRTRTAFFDASQDATRSELEADGFALDALKRAYSAGVLGNDPAIIAEVSAAGLSDDLPPDQALTGALLFAAAQMSTGLLFSRGSISALYEDQRHPSYGSRIHRLAELLTEQVGGDPAYSAYVAYFRAKVARIDSFRQLGLIEVHADDPIVRLVFDDEGLLLFDQNWNAARVASADLARTDRGPVKMLHAGAVSGPERPAGEGLAAVWSLKGQGVTLLSEDGRAYSMGSGGDEPQGTRDDFDASAEIISAPQPSDVVIRDNGPSLRIMRADGAIHTVRWDVLLAIARRDGHVESPTTRNVVLSGDTLEAAIHDDGGPLVGALFAKTEPPFEAQFVRLNVEGAIDSTGELAIVNDAGARRYFLAGKTDLNAQVSIWELDPTKPPVLKRSYAPLLDSLASLPPSGQNIPVVVDDIRAFGPRSIFIALLGDSVLRYDAKDDRLEAVFPGTGAHLTASRQGLLAFTLLNAYKAFILPLKDE